MVLKCLGNKAIEVGMKDGNKTSRNSKVEKAKELNNCPRSIKRIRSTPIFTKITRYECEMNTPIIAGIFAPRHAFTGELALPFLLSIIKRIKMEQGGAGLDLRD